MPNILVAPDLPKLLVEQRGILTVEAQDATVSCNCTRDLPCGGIDVDKMELADRTLQQHVYYMGQRFIERLAVRGYELAGYMRLHGPWPSYNFQETLADVASSVWAQAEADDDPSQVLQFVGERNQQLQLPALMDYRLVGNFLKTAVLTEIIVPDKTEE